VVSQQDEKSQHKNKAKASNIIPPFKFIFFLIKSSIFLNSNKGYLETK